MPVHSDSDLRFAILIDADNISEKYVKIILDEVSNLGIATYKRIYGDWTSSRLGSWKGCLLENSIIPVQQYSYTYGKNATDSAMIIDAMDILYSGHVDGFAIVSSDSDFTRLASRLREGGMQVIGMGEQKTPEPFISACNQFKYLDLLYASRKADGAAAIEDAADAPSPKRYRRQQAPKAQRTRQEKNDQKPEGEPAEAAARAKRHPGDSGGEQQPQAPAGADLGDVDFSELSRSARRRHIKRIRCAVDDIIDQFSDEEGWVALGAVGSELPKRLPDFDVRNYGYKKLSPFLKSLGIYEFDERQLSAGSRAVYLRMPESQG